MTARICLPAWTVVAAAVLAFGSGACSRRSQDAPDAPDAPGAVPSRIVSLAPSVTETLFALGLGERVVGVTRYCDYPDDATDDATDKPKVGGFEDLSYEAIAALRPDLIVLLDAHAEPAARLSALGWRVLSVRHETLEGILESIDRLGRTCAAEERAADLLADLRARMDAVRRATEGRPRPRVLMALGGAIGEEGAGQIYIAGRGVFYERLLELAGGRNAYDGPLIFPAVSLEGVLHMNPDVIVFLSANPNDAGGGLERLPRGWDRFDGIKAVRDGAIVTLAGGHVTVPGPRFARTLEDLARVLHPASDLPRPLEGPPHDD